MKYANDFAIFKSALSLKGNVHNFIVILAPFFSSREKRETIYTSLPF